VNKVNGFIRRLPLGEGQGYPQVIHSVSFFKILQKLPRGYN